MASISQIKRTLIVAPLSILGVWYEEFAKFADFDYTLTVLTGSSEKKVGQLRNLAGSGLLVAVVNYESAWRMEKELVDWRPDLIVADEGHKIKTHNIAASKAMHRLGALAKYKLLLTGTPVTNKAIDIFSQYKFLNPAIFGGSFYSFRNRYFDMMGYGNYTPVLKKSMEPELIKKMHSVAFRATKAECLDLPETTDIIRHVELEPRAMSIYRDLVRDSYAELSKGEITITNILTKLLRLSQLTGGFIGNDENSATEQVSCAKLDALDDIIDAALEENRKLVIIARFVPELKAICMLLDKKGIRHSLIMGGVRDRDLQVSQFQNDPDIPVFIGQVATAGLAKPKKNSDHPTSKPLDLLAYPIRNSSQPNGIVLDTFGGSGSTLIACEQTDRICFMLELDEKYASVILRRYAEFKDNGGADITCDRSSQQFAYAELVKEVENRG